MIHLSDEWASWVDGKRRKIGHAEVIEWVKGFRALQNIPDLSLETIGSPLEGISYLLHNDKKCSSMVSDFFFFQN